MPTPDATTRMGTPCLVYAGAEQWAEADFVCLNWHRPVREECVVNLQKVGLLTLPLSIVALLYGPDLER